MRYYYLYKISNLVNGKIYIGVHETKKLEDGYFGSGTLLKKAILKYGRENFKKEIIAFFDNRQDMLDAEKKIVDINFVKQANVYNIALGGERGKPVYGKNGQSGFGLENLTNGAESKALMIQRGTWEQHKTRMSMILKEKYSKGYVSIWVGRKHKETTKKLIGAKSSIHQKGEQNSQFGTFWAYSDEEKLSKKFKKSEQLPSGWKLGRKLKF